MEKDGDRNQGSKRIDPWNMESCIRSQADQGDKSQVGTGGRLNRIRRQRCMIDAPCFLTL